MRQLRRHQFFLINGGGLLITIVVLAACALEVWSSAREHLSRVQEELASDARHISELSARTTATLRNNVQNIEIALRDVEPVDEQLLKQYEAGQAVLAVRSQANSSPVLLIGDNTSNNRQDAWPYIRLAKLMSPALSVIVKRNSGELSSYLISSDKRFMLLAMAPWPEDAWQQKLAQQRRQLVQKLSGGDEQNDEKSKSLSIPTLRWLAPRQSLLTGKSAITIATGLLGADGKSFGTLFFELPVEILTNELAGSEFSGDCAVFDKTGQVIVTCRGALNQKQIEAAQKGMQLGFGSTYRRDYRDGQFFYGRSLGQNGWTLVYYQNWRDIAIGIFEPLLISVFAAGAIIALTWSLLLLLQSRVLRPALERSAQVFESEQLSRTLIETAPMGLALVNIDSGEALLSSPPMVDMQGRVRGVDGGLPGELMRQYIQHGGRVETLNQDMTFNTEQGEPVTLAVSMSAARFRGQDVMVSTFINITDKKRLQQGLLQAKEAADRANAAKSSFLASMSHEIRTPLNAILGNLELLTHTALDSQLGRLDVIRRASDSLLAVISDVLDFSKIEAGELQLERVEYDALEVAANVLAVFEPVARAKGILLTGHLSDTLTQFVKGDPVRLGQVLYNLISNALKFTERGQVSLRVVLETELQMLRIDVHDTGIGMSDEQVQQAFQAFRQADESINRRYGGTGLGLALCMRLAEAMGGKLSVRSALGKGSTFELSVPLGMPVQAERPTFSDGHILVVAAREDWRTYLPSVLRGWGLSVGIYQHPAQLSEVLLTRADALVLWGDRQTWHVNDEKRLIDESSWVIDCRSEGVCGPVANGHILETTIHGLKGLAIALRHVLQGQPLPVRQDFNQRLPGLLHVLVAEDNPVNRRLFQEQLELLGCTVQLAENGEQALSHLESEAFDVLLTDLSMPGMDGYALAQAARERWPQMPVVAATASVTLQEQERCRAVGMAAVLSKPLSLRELGRALRESCGLSSTDDNAVFVQTAVATQDDAADWLGGQALPAEVRLMFEKTCMDALKVLRQARDVIDEQRILNELHSLRGALGVFRMDALSKQATALDSQVRALGLEQASDNLRMFCEELEMTVLRSPALVQELIQRILQLAKAGADRATILEIHRLGQELESVLEQSGAIHLAGKV
nr:hypothetical protein FFPRI1PSEUD_24400 [Pseudomonas sp. FFPRI_1]